jgi:hypothetical protein
MRTGVTYEDRGYVSGLGLCEDWVMRDSTIVNLE